MKSTTKQKIRSFIDALIILIFMSLAVCGDLKMDLLLSIFAIAIGIIIILLLIKDVLK